MAMPFAYFRHELSTKEEMFRKEKEILQTELSTRNQRFNDREKVIAEEKLEKEKLIQSDFEKQRNACSNELEKAKGECKKDLKLAKEEYKKQLDACNKHLNEKNDESTFVKVDLATYRGMSYIVLPMCGIAGIFLLWCLCCSGVSISYQPQRHSSSPGLTAGSK